MRLVWITFAALAIAPLVLWVAQLEARPNPLPPPIPGPPEPEWAAGFWARAKPLLDEHGGAVSLYLSEPRRNTVLKYDADRPVYLASGIKLLFMVELFHQREEGTLSFDEELPYRRKDVRDGAPSMNKLLRGRAYPIDDLLTYMMRDSDNAAADLLLTRIGAQQTQRRLQSQGFYEVGPIVPLLDVRREVYERLDGRASKLDAVQLRDVRWRNGFEPRLDILKKHIGPPYGRYGQSELDRAYDEYYALGRNHASLRVIGEVYEAMLEGRLVSEAADEEMLSILRQVWTCECRVDRELPADVRVAHKTGTQHERIIDLAIVWIKDEPLVFNIVVEGERLASQDLIAELARIAIELSGAQLSRTDSAAPG